MCLGVIFLPVVPRLIGRVEVFPIVGGAGEVIRGEHRLGDDVDERVIGCGEVSTLGFYMSLLDHVDVIRDDGSFLVLWHHLSINIDDTYGMKFPNARAEMQEECGGGNVGV